MGEELPYSVYGFWGTSVEEVGLQGIAISETAMQDWRCLHARGIGLWIGTIAVGGFVDFAERIK